MSAIGEAPTLLEMSRERLLRRVEAESRPMVQPRLRAPGVWWAACVLSLALPFVAIARTPELRDAPLGLDAYMPVPEDNPLTDAKVRLGRRLFFDPVLSRDRSMSCSTCHDPERAYTDGRAVSVGVFGRTGARNVPTLLNRGYGTAFFWDGRMPTLERQVLAPIENVNELDITVEEVMTRLRRDRGYVQTFRTAFDRDLNAEDLARALAAYVRSILAGDSPVDRYLAGDRGALPPEAQAGLRLFRGKANCTACHLGPTFTDERFHNTGVAWSTVPRPGAGASAGIDTAAGFQDQGREAVTQRREDRGAFKTPTLRDVARTAPYMHDGSFMRLEDVIEFYNEGGRANPFLDGEIRPLHLSDDDKSALLAFLRALSGSIVEGR